MKTLALFLIVLSAKFSFIASSAGDRSAIYQRCYNSCKKDNCIEGYIAWHFNRQSTIKQGFWANFFFWSCRDECQYLCMWKTVHAFEEAGHEVPKFHGKWPFRRMMGLQEPASTLASIANLATNYYMLSELEDMFPNHNHPSMLFWRLFAYASMNAWFWSTIFHARDYPFTEFMDYISALGMVIVFFISAALRVFKWQPMVTPALVGGPVLVFLWHVLAMLRHGIDYSHNMFINLCFGVAGGALWLAWGAWQVAGGRRYVWRLVAFTVLTGAALALELLDFPPKYGWDAHALWHLSTVPLPLLFYRFVIDDTRHARMTDQSKLI